MDPLLGYLFNAFQNYKLQFLDSLKSCKIFLTQNKSLHLQIIVPSLFFLHGLFRRYGIHSGIYSLSSL